MSDLVGPKDADEHYYGISLRDALRVDRKPLHERLKRARDAALLLDLATDGVKLPDELQKIRLEQPTGAAGVPFCKPGFVLPLTFLLRQEDNRR